MESNENTAVVPFQQGRPTVFMDLPYEIRMEIWKYALTRRLLRLASNRKAYHRLPLLTQVCREAREFVLQSSSAFSIPGYSSNGEEIMRQTWFNRRLDILKLANWEPDWPFWARQFFDTVETIAIPFHSLVGTQRYPRQLVRDITKGTVFPQLKVLLVIVGKKLLLWPDRGRKPIITRQEIYDFRFDVAWDNDGTPIKPDASHEDEPSGDSSPTSEFLGPFELLRIVSECGSGTPGIPTGPMVFMPIAQPASDLWEDIAEDPMFYEVPENSTKVWDVQDALDNKDGWEFEHWKWVRWGTLSGWYDSTRGQVEDEFMKAFRPLYVRTEGGDASTVTEMLTKDHPWVKNKFQQLPKIRPALELYHPWSTTPP